MTWGREAAARWFRAEVGEKSSLGEISGRSDRGRRRGGGALRAAWLTPLLPELPPPPR